MGCDADEGFTAGCKPEAEQEQARLRAQRAAPLDGSVVMARFLALHRYLSRYSRHIMNDLGISGRKLAGLRYIHQVGKATVGDIAGYLTVRYSSASEMITKLEAQGLVQRARDADDSRVVWIDLTDAGRELIERSPLGGLGLLRERLKAVEADELEQINEVVMRLAELVEMDWADQDVYR